MSGFCGAGNPNETDSGAVRVGKISEYTQQRDVRFLNDYDRCAPNTGRKSQWAFTAAFDP